MITIISYNRVAKEQNIIEKGCRNETAKRTDDKLVFQKVSSFEGLDAEDVSNSLTDIIYYEIRDKADVERLRQLRQGDIKALLMLLTSSSLSPMQYLKPGISPDLLLLRPFGQADFDAVNAELFDALLSARDLPDAHDNFVLNSREGKMVIPYDRIIFFEACNKKINLRTGNEEFDFYDSIDNISRTLPDYFVRCHRAYLINAKKIRKVKLSEGLIEMGSGAVVPLSRTYKQDIKEWMG